MHSSPRLPPQLLLSPLSPSPPYCPVCCCDKIPSQRATSGREGLFGIRILSALLSLIAEKPSFHRELDVASHIPCPIKCGEKGRVDAQRSSRFLNFYGVGDPKPGNGLGLPTSIKTWYRQPHSRAHWSNSSTQFSPEILSPDNSRSG